MKVDYNPNDHNFSVCFTGFDSLTIYVHLYRTDSLGYLLMYYNVPNTTTTT